MRRAFALAPLLLALAAAGCSNPNRTYEEKAEGAVDTLLKTCGTDRPQAATELLTPSARQAFSRAGSPLGGCLEVLGLRLRGDAQAVRHALLAARVVSSRANAASGIVVVEAPRRTRSRIEAESSGGVWRVVHSARP